MDDLAHKRLETETLVIGYAMSRLDHGYLRARNLSTWQEAYDEAATKLSVPQLSLKNLRDEFDPVHPNGRKGWHLRPMRPSRLRIINEMTDISDEALVEFIDRILSRDEDAVEEAIDALAVVTRRPANVAERLLTGRRAEEYFLANSQAIVQVERELIVDLRQSAVGFDFGVKNKQTQAIEVKGVKGMSGGIQFTDWEWSQAKYRRSDYWLVVIGNLAGNPIPLVIQ